MFIEIKGHITVRIISFIDYLVKSRRYEDHKNVVYQQLRTNSLCMFNSGFQRLLSETCDIQTMVFRSNYSTNYFSANYKRKHDRRFSITLFNAFYWKHIFNTHWIRKTSFNFVLQLVNLVQQKINTFKIQNAIESSDPIPAKGQALMRHWIAPRNETEERQILCQGGAYYNIHEVVVLVAFIPWTCKPGWTDEIKVV